MCKISILFTVSLVLASSLCMAQGNNGLVAHWNFNGNLNDISGHNLTGTNIGTTSTAGFNGIANTARLFDGISNYIDVPYNSIMNLDSMSICILFKPEGYNTDPCQVSSLVLKGKENTSDFYRLDFHDNSADNNCSVVTTTGNRFHYGIGSSNPITAASYMATPAVQLQTWYCVVGTFKGGILKVYVDGTLVQTENYPLTMSPGAVGINIGCALNSNINYPYYFKGRIDDVRIYSRPLNALEADTYCDSAKHNPLSTGIVTAKDAISIFPNPTNDILNISCGNTPVKGSITIVNMLGQKMLSQSLTTELTKIDLTSFPTGAYFITCEYNGEVFTDKFLKQ